MLKIYFAPMEGLTDDIFRRVHHECFSGVSAYYIPFISPTQNLVLTSREKRAVLPDHNRGVPCVPQILAKDPEHFLWAAGCMADFGYQEVNLNAGCPSRTVTAKGKGAGMLKEPEKLDAFLDRVCAASPLPLSVKTRVGYDSPEEWERLLTVYRRYPIQRLIVHARACRERYDPGTIHRECWQAAAEAWPGDLVLNGDLFTPADVSEILQLFPRVSGVMLGRGLVAVPSLARELQGGPPLQKEEIVHFHNRLLEELLKEYPAHTAFMKLRVIMKHLACGFAETGKLEREIRRADSLNELLDADARLFARCALKPRPAFVPDEITTSSL